MPPVEKDDKREAPWRSMAELADAPQFRRFLEAEFPAAADPRGVDRRRWLQLMGASLALAGVAGCRWPKEETLPFVHRPPGRKPGVPQRFATAMDFGSSATGLVVTSYDGRPIKVEGNPKHPQSLGATGVYAQAAVLELYDPDRSRRVVQRQSGQEVRHPGWEKFDQFARLHFGSLRRNQGAGLAVLAEASSSPTIAAQRAALLAACPQAAWFEFEPVSDDNCREGARRAFGRPLRTHYALDKAGVILCLDADLLGSHPAAVRHVRDFARTRCPEEGPMSRLYVVESSYSTTGAAADHRLAVRSCEVGTFLAALEKALAGASSEAAEMVRKVGGGPAEKFLQALAADLRANRGGAGGHAPLGPCLVAAGRGQPPEVHAAVHRVDAALGAVGTTVLYTEDPDPQRPAHVEALQALAERIDAGKIETLVLLGGNPVYDAPADVDFAAVLAKVPLSIHLSRYDNETSRRCAWHLPQAHFLEAWGDGRAYDGTYSVVQPLIEPIWQARSSIELLALMRQDPASKAYDLVRETFRRIAGEEDWEARWRQAVHDGLLAETQWPTVEPEPAATGGSSADTGGSLVEMILNPFSRSGGNTTGEVAESGALEIVFHPDPSVHDGRFANNGWLQEMPAPMTRLTWDNAAVLSPATARELKVENDTLVRLTVGGATIEIPVLVVPGHADGSIAVALGYGRTQAGQVGGSLDHHVQPVGVDVSPLRFSHAMDVAVGVSVEPTGRRYRLATTQDHHAIDSVAVRGRADRLGQLVRETTLAEYRERPEAIRHAVHLPGGVAEDQLKSLWTEHSYDEGHRWSMAIDLNKCVGCGACVVACQAENNIPVVGKQRVLEGREMHWLRVDRYFRGDPEKSPRAVHQPVACHQCENAPCEQVCPVAATVHSHEGLNVMVYNRCVGTRYCANNCPYKVRRFNFFYYHGDLDNPDNEVAKMAFNPEVTVRTRGVMEKCTYCVQRIQAAKIDAKNNHRPIEDGEIQTACQQVCPARAIEFGDLNDPASRVAEAHALPRAYGMLAELNVKPRTKYLARVRNPHPALEDADHDHGGHPG